MLEQFVELDVDVSDLPLDEMFRAAAVTMFGDLRGPRLPHPTRVSFLNMPFDASKKSLHRA